MSHLSNPHSPLRLCLMLAEDGPAGLWAPSAIASAELAVSELNARGGILGREVVLTTADCGAHGTIAARNALSAEEEGAEAVIGMFPSYARADVARAIGGRLPFLYTPPFEGGERDANIITTGETIAELLGVGIGWLSERRSAQRFFLCGADYRWPRESFATASGIIARHGGGVVGQAFQRIGDHDFDLVLQAIIDSGADAVVPMYLGMDAVAFNRAFAAAGLSGRVLRCAPGLDETMLYGLHPDETENLYSVSGYFAAHRSANNGSYLERYHMKFGECPPPANTYGQSAYEGISSFAALAQASRSTAPAALRAAMAQGVAHRTARSGGLLSSATRNSVMLGRVDGYEIDILREVSVGNHH